MIFDEMAVGRGLELRKESSSAAAVFIRKSQSLKFVQVSSAFTVVIRPYSYEYEPFNNKTYLFFILLNVIRCTLSFDNRHEV